ncbi:hypothetical protein Tco_0625537 [Tanacetum coccineum]|uniref:Uncharacterized protein n=1 Tax=Tanacetum coccineum TaxID=301880 RepID=A0ABQ4WH37_9ASTR
MSKEVGTPRYLSLVVPLKKVGDEVVHKELGDRMERAATTASSLEAEQDSGSGPRCQDTILGDVDAQTRFEITSKQSNDPPLSRGYTLRSGEDSMKLFELMELCTQLSYKNRKSVLFLLLVYINAAKIMLGSVNAVRHMLILSVQVSAAEESSIRSDLHLDDAEGIDCLPTATIFIELARMSAKSTAWNEFSSTMDSFITCLATNQKFNLSKYIFDVMVKHLDGWVKFLMYPHFLQVFINQKLGDMSHHKKFFVNPFHTKKVFANMKRANHPTKSDQIPIINQPSTSSQPKQKQKSKRRQRTEAKVPQDETEHEESVPIPSNDPQPSGEDSMQLNDLMVLCTKLQAQVLDLEKAKDAQAKEIAALKKRVQRLERKKKSRTTGLRRLKKVGMSRRVKSSEDQEKRQDDDLMFDTGVLDDDEVFVDVTTIEKEEQSTKTGEAVTTTGVEDSVAPIIPTTIEETLAQTLMEIKAAKLKVKGIVFHDQEEQADRLLAVRLQTREREELTDEEKGKLFMELMEKRRKHFAELRAQEKRNRPPTRAQKRTQMSTYLKHMGGYKHKQLMGKSYDEIQKLFDKEMKRVNIFVAMSSEA